MVILQGITEDIEGASTLAEFEVIEIVDDNNPYPTLLGIDWATNMNEVTNLKKHKMTFEKKSLRIVVPLDPAKVSCYTELMHEYESDDDLDYNYKITAREQDWVNPTTDGRISWEHEISHMSDLDEEIERWQNQLHEVTTLKYNMMTRSLHCILIKMRDFPTYNGLGEVDGHI